LLRFIYVVRRLAADVDLVYTAITIPGAKLSIYEAIGHSPFYEDAPRFNGELAAFVRAANKTD